MLHAISGLLLDNLAENYELAEDFFGGEADQ